MGEKIVLKNGIFGIFWHFFGLINQIVITFHIGELYLSIIRQSVFNPFHPLDLPP
jgi:hypothetical protein